MIDTHCHLLPRLDDGPRSAAESVELARALVGQGVQAVLCTPHYSRRYPTSPQAARERLAELRRDLAELDVPLRIELAAEVSHRLALSVPLTELRERSFRGFVVVELEPAAPLTAPLHIAERLTGAGLVPILAHPERCRVLRADPATLDAARAAGALVQVVSSSLAGRWGRPVVDAAWSLLDSERVDLVASDAHVAHGSVLRLGEVLGLATARYGAAVVSQLTEQEPARILNVELAPN